MSRARAYDRAGAPLQAKTAATWAKRAVRAYNRYLRTGDSNAFLDGECHRGEALEHAGLVADFGRTAARVQKMIDVVRERAWRSK